MKPRRIITILIFIIGVNYVYAQTETPKLLIDSVKPFETEQFLQRNNMNNLLHNPYPVKLPVIDLHDQNNLPSKTASNNTTSANLRFVRSAFATNESPLFGKLPVKPGNEITIKLKEEFIKSIIFEFKMKKKLNFYLIHRRYSQNY